eukprot:838011-Amphidinium_carterae.1
MEEYLLNEVSKKHTSAVSSFRPRKVAGDTGREPMTEIGGGIDTDVGAHLEAAENHNPPSPLQLLLRLSPRTARYRSGKS